MMTTTTMQKIRTFRSSLYCTDVLDIFDPSGLLVSTIDSMEVMDTSDLENATRYDTMLSIFNATIDQLQEYVSDLQQSRKLLEDVACQWEDDLIAEYGQEEVNKWTR